jgi:hypothetical protein
VLRLLDWLYAGSGRAHLSKRVLFVENMEEVCVLDFDLSDQLTVFREHEKILSVTVPVYASCFVRI